MVKIVVAIVLLATVATLHGCASEPGNPPSREDAGPTPDAVVMNDRTTPPPETPAPPDVPAPPGDRPPVPEDRPVQPPDAAARERMLAIGDRPSEYLWRVPGAADGGSITVERNLVFLGERLGNQIVARYSEGAFDMPSMTILFPPGGAADGCRFYNLSPEMFSFRVNCNGRENSLEFVPRGR